MAKAGSALEVFQVFLKLGLTSFGGPVAHLGYFRQAIVGRLGWLDEKAYAELVALCQFLPGPASSQVGIGIGLMRAGPPGALAAWAGFTLPSALLLMAFAFNLTTLEKAFGTGWMHGLKLAAVAVVAQAVWSMARSLTPDRQRMSLALAVTALLLFWQSPLAQIAALLAGAWAGLLLFRKAGAKERPCPLPLPIGRRTAWVCLLLFALLLAGLPLAAWLIPDRRLALFSAFYRSGSLIFGGGHVVLPLLESSVVAPGWISQPDFLAGYGAAQAVPGPLLTFSAYLGAMIGSAPNGVAGAALALAAIFLPSFLLVFAALPFWSLLRERPGVRAAMTGVNAAVVGLLLATLYHPVFTAGLRGPADFAIAAAALLLLEGWRWPPWLVVLLSAAAGAVLTGPQQIVQ
ncbi:MAG: chromate efflux transporter [Rhodospirillales bacterium]|nr:chromate efflux transporter [Rhodospirillales bacterium]